MINCIVAVTNTGIIGDSQTNDMLWHLPEDMRRFRDLTTSHIVLMGRYTYESIPEALRPLKNRTNIVCSKNKAFLSRLEQLPTSGGVLIGFRSLRDAVREYRRTEHLPRNKGLDLFVIGGGAIYEQAFNHCDRFYITLVDEGIHGIEDSPSRVRFPIRRLFDGVDAGIFEITKNQSLHGVKYLTIERRPRGFFRTLLHRLFS